MDRRILSATVILALSPQLAFADTRDDVMAAMQRCRTFPDDRTWLECTYGAQQAMRAKLGLAPAPDYQQRLVPPATSAVAAPLPVPASPPSANAAAPRPAPVTAPRRKASIMQILTGTAPPVAVSNVASVEYGANDAFLVTLQNGQTWHQVNAGVAPKARFKPGTKVTIKPGALGSYNLQADGHSYKVELKS